MEKAKQNSYLLSEGQKQNIAVGSSITETTWDVVMVEKVNKVLEGVRNGTLKMDYWTQASLRGDRG